MAGVDGRVDGRVDGVIVNVTKEKQLTHMLMANLAAPCCRCRHPVFLIGHKESGIQFLRETPILRLFPNRKTRER